MILTGEFRGIFYTKLFRNQIEAAEFLNVEMYTKASINFETCQGVRMEIPLIDVIEMFVHDDPEDEEE